MHGQRCSRRNFTTTLGILVTRASLKITRSIYELIGRTYLAIVYRERARKLHGDSIIIGDVVLLSVTLAITHRCKNSVVVSINFIIVTHSSPDNYWRRPRYFFSKSRQSTFPCRETTHLTD